jgi:hypothetical protein
MYFLFLRMQRKYRKYLQAVHTFQRTTTKLETLKAKKNK